MGNWTVTLSINFGGAQLILSAISLWNEEFVANEWQTILCFWACMLLCYLINIFGSRYLDLINTLCIYWVSTMSRSVRSLGADDSRQTGASIFIIMIVILVMSPSKRSGEFVFANYDASASGWPTGCKLLPHP